MFLPPPQYLLQAVNPQIRGEPPQTRPDDCTDTSTLNFKKFLHIYSFSIDNPLHGSI
jgi:hypothetical protein